VKLRGEAEANSEIPRFARNKSAISPFLKRLPRTLRVLAMTDAIDICDSYRWIWVILDAHIAKASMKRRILELSFPQSLSGNPEYKGTG